MSRKKSVKYKEIWVNDINQETAKSFRQQVIDAYREDPAQPLILYIDSYGGAVDSLIVMLETLDQVSNPVITACIGKAMSCGAVLLAWGQFRTCGRHSRVMIHEISVKGSTEMQNVHDIYSEALQLKKVNEYVIGLLAKKCKFKSYKEFRAFLREFQGRDVFFDAEQALKLNIVDAIGLPVINSSNEVEVVQEVKKHELKIKT